MPLISQIRQFVFKEIILSLKMNYRIIFLIFAKIRVKILKFAKSLKKNNLGRLNISPPINSWSPSFTRRVTRSDLVTLLLVKLSLAIRTKAVSEISF